MLWICKPCKFQCDLVENARIRRHIASKRHQRYRFACPNCSSLRMRRIVGETWDRDGIRLAQKCQKCLTEYKVYAHGIVEKDPHEYTGLKPQHIVEQEAKAFDERARARGYIRPEDCNAV